MEYARQKYIEYCWNGISTGLKKNMYFKKISLYLLMNREIVAQKRTISLD